jgi:hypothetical protein
VAAVAELLLVMAAQAGSREAFLVDLTVERNKSAVAVAHYIFAPLNQHLHVRGAHGASGRNAFFLIGGHLQFGRLAR